MIKKKKQIDYKIITLVFVILFSLSIIFNTILNQPQTKYDRACKSIGLDYANVDLVFAQFECCKIYEVSDWGNNQTLQTEGCSSPLDFEVLE